MRKVYLIHGWDGYPEEGWRPWLRDELILEGFETIVPAMPDTKTPTLEKWLPFLQDLVKKPDSDTYFVGHSLGCITILRYIESLNQEQRIGGVVLVAGFSTDLDYKTYKGELASFFKNPINWDKIKTNCKKFVSICSDNDPFVNLTQSKFFEEKLGAEELIMHDMSHFSGDDGVDELPEALEALLRMSGSSESH